MYHFCTYFDHRYLTRGLALYQSLAAHCRSFRLWALCFDALSYQVVSRLGYENLAPITLEEFEKGDAELPKTKRDRSPLEYYFTCTPSLPLYVLNRNPGIDMITYLDSDLFLFQDPTPVFREIGGRSIAVTEHRHPPESWSTWTKENGVYNVGWLSFRNDPSGLACLHWWRERCLEWCYNRGEDGRYGDQKYLEEWPVRFSGFVALGHQGVNVAPWNLVCSDVRTRGGKVLVNGDPLIAFHFHGLTEVQRFVYDFRREFYRIKLTTTLKQKIFAPYIKTLVAMHRESSRIVKTAPLLGSLKQYWADGGTVRPPTGPLAPIYSGLLKARKMVRLIRDIRRKKYLFVIGGHAL
jgi:hypothetical protein